MDEPLMQIVRVLVWVALVWLVISPFVILSALKWQREGLRTMARLLDQRFDSQAVVLQGVWDEAKDLQARVAPKHVVIPTITARLTQDTYTAAEVAQMLAAVNEHYRAGMPLN
jgi:hypothetical protein